MPPLWKAEAAADARYLHDLLQLLLQADVYLDSSNLTDLRKLFNRGVAQSETLILIASASVLHSPWCLLEIWKAHLSAIPVIILAKPGFSMDGASRFLHALESELDIVNPGALDEVMRQAMEMRAAMQEEDAGAKVGREESSFLPEPTAGSGDCRQARKAFDASGGARASAASPNARSEAAGSSLADTVHCARQSISLGNDWEEQAATNEERSCARRGSWSSGGTTKSWGQVDVEQFKSEVIAALGLDGPGCEDTESAATAEASVTHARGWSGHHGPGGENRKGHMIRWSPNGTDEQILASVIDLVEQMAHQTGRHLKWSRDESRVQMDTHHAPQVERPLSCTRFCCKRLRRRLGWRDGDGPAVSYKLFICYVPGEARGVARFLQLALQRVLRGPVVEEVGAEVQGVPTHDDLDELLLAVEHSEAVMLIQTASVLYRPWTLLQLYTALCLSKPIICLHVDQGGYDHFAMRQLLENMRQQLDEFSPGAFEVRSTLTPQLGGGWALMRARNSQPFTLRR